MPVFVALVVVADVASGGAVRKEVKKGVDAVIDAGGKVVDKVVDVGRAIAKDPLPVVATVALSAVGVPPPVAAAAVTAAKGGTVSQIATAAVASYAGGQVGSKVGSYTAGTQTAAQVATATGTSVEAVAKVAASASGSSVAATTAAVIQGKDLGTALKEGAIAGVGGGVGEGVAQGVAANVPIQNRLGQAGVAGAAGGAAQAAVTGEDIAKGAIVSGISTAGATFLGDKRAEAAAKDARQKQVVEAFSQPKTAGVGGQVGAPTASLNQTSDIVIDGRVYTYQITGTTDNPIVTEIGSKAYTPTAAETQANIVKTITQRPPSGAGAEGFEYAGRPVGADEIIVMGGREPPISYVPPTGLARFTPSRTQPGGAGTSTISERDRQIMDMTGLTRAPKPTEDAAQTSRLPEVEVTGERPIDRLGVTEVTGERDQVASQTFPLTEQTAAGRSRPIDFMYQNIGAPMGMAYGGREMGAGTSALAQALSVGDPGALYLGKKGKERRPVWNVESLKLSDELGGTYG